MTAQDTPLWALSLCSVTAIADYLYLLATKSQPRRMLVAQTIKKLDQQRHELKALRYLLEFYPESIKNLDDIPSREDFQIEDTRSIYDALMSAKTKDEATKTIAALALDETDVESFLRLG